ncbi:MAG: DNA replication/repair protein RecF [Alphaproteobacteria bacterium]|nr:DNA replication/repair protein RecF [Alphaproteobacteria bacterium]
MPEARRVVSIQDSTFRDPCLDPGILASDPLSISQITLTQFRNYEHARLVCDAAPVVITGANGGGKTNLLEALSLLVPGRGLRRSSLGDFQNRASDKPWAVAIELRTDTGPLLIGTGRDCAASCNDEERRLIHIDGKPARGQTILAEHIALAWITPDMDRLLAEGSAARRKFLDRLAFSFDPAHGGRVRAYEKAMRERLHLLREGRADPLWLDALENEMARRAVAIAAARRHMISRLSKAIAESGPVFPRADIDVRGTAEDLLEHQPALLVEDALRAAFARARREDAASGTCATGAHRSDLRVRHRAKNCPADLCSTGEQKALLIAVMLAYVRLLSEHRRMKPLFLLDDIAAHLDDFRRAALFDEILSLGAQAWLTGTDQAPFSRLAPFAQMLQVENGAIFG